LILAIDSSQSSGSVAIQADGRIIYSAFFDIKITHSETLMPAIDHALTFCEAKREQLEAVYVCNGPGSFTGLRIGLATAKGIAFGLGIPLYTFSSLQLAALPAQGLGKNILVCIDAKMKELYYALFSPDLCELMPPQIIQPDALADIELRDFILCGSGTEIMHPLFCTKNIPHFQLNSLMQIPSAAGLFSLGKILADQLVPQNLAELEPLYLRESTAQVRARKASK
jgi:tRNA threonylcarbamoyladenosine biosynthesis protein TsaB